MLKRRNAMKAGLGSALALLPAAAARANESISFKPFEGLEDFWLATDAYVFGYPLVTMEMTRRIMTNVAAPQGTRADGSVHQDAPVSRRDVQGRHRAQR